MSDLTPQESEQLLAHARTVLSLNENEEIDKEPLYHSLPLCVVDAVFSINAKYPTTQNVVNRYATYTKSPMWVGEVGDEAPLTDLVTLCNTLGAERMADEVFQNRQRTSTKNGILKAEAVARFAAALVAHGITRRSDIAALTDEQAHALKAAITDIPGPRSGISLRYFWMKTGDYSHVKPDRMLMRFVSNAIGRTVAVPVCATAITTLATHLQADYPHLNPRTLDARIWHYQRTL
jgi:hypothetical protein